VHDRLRGGIAAVEIVAVEADVDVAERDGWPPVFSTISWAMRTSVRRTSSRSRTVFSLKALPLPGLTGPG
jgi:hypothetical protein